ncbi:MAG: regulatory protein GemA [Candidatus Thiodiazotropha sp. (ex Dulcina madagascariensis)]|nr:regulatory protein GemA [Candidatus Thiodiazotropha sp. (ex Dulcina madagascariensis)]
MAQNRNNELAMIHMGAKDLGLDPYNADPDSAYRQMLWNVAKVRSAADLDGAGRQAIIKHLKSRGWNWKPRKRRQHRQAGLIYHLWNRLADAGVVRHRDGLSSWLQTNTEGLSPRRTGWQKPEFMPPRVRSNVIEQLKKWAERENVSWQ